MAGWSLRIGFLLAASSVHAHGITHAPPVTGPTTHKVHASSSLAPAPAGVTDLKFDEFYVMPVSPRGLTMTQKLLGLDGRKVRISGYIARQEDPRPGLFILAPRPVNIAELADGPADDLPPAHVFVRVPSSEGKTVRYPFGFVSLIGTLSLGRADEADGRVSWVRLILDAAPGLANNEASAEHR